MVERVVKTEEIENLIHLVLNFIDEKDFQKAKEQAEKAYKVAQKNKSNEDISICMSLIAFLDYSENKDCCSQALALLEDSRYMAQRSNSDTALLINELALGNIHFAQDSKDIALIHYNNALKLSTEEDRYSLANTINTRIRQLQNIHCQPKVTLWFHL